MLTLDTKKRQPKKRSRSAGARAGVGRAGVGIDIGAWSTKVVHYDPTQEPSLICGSLPSLGGSSYPLDEAPSMELAVNSEAAVDRRRQSSQQRDYSRWSGGQIESLASRISSALSPDLAGRTPIRVTLGMATCDLRSIQVQPTEKLKQAELHQRLVQAIGDTRKRSFALLDGHQEPNRQKILSVPEDLVDGLAMGLDNVGLTPESIDALPWSLVRLLPQTDEKIQIAIDWGYTNPTLVASSQGEILYLRRLKAGSIQSVIAPLCTAYELSEAEAMRWLAHCLTDLSTAPDSKFYSDDPGDQASQACQKLAREIDSSTEFIRWKYPDKQIGGLTLTGGAAELQGLVRLLTRHVSLEVHTWTKQTGNLRISPRYAHAALLAEGS